MFLLKNLASWFLLACLVQQVSSARERGRRPKGKAVAESTSGKSAPPKGKFSTTNLQCTWVAREDGAALKLRIRCRNPGAHDQAEVTAIACEYDAKPASCAGYVSNPAGFWKEVARSLRRLRDKVCQDKRTLVRTGMCRSAPKDAHFKLGIVASEVIATQRPGGVARPLSSSHVTPTPNATCAERVDQRKLGEEYCGSSWASLCTFFFTMVQNVDC